MSTTPAPLQLRTTSWPLEDIEVEEESAPIRWINLIFLPFHPVFRLLILCTVVIKCMIGPFSSVHMYMICPENAPTPSVEIMYLRYLHDYICTPFFIVDTLLRIIHRQIKDEATKRVHPPTPCFLVMLDILAIIPIYRLTHIERCPNIALWPNILTFSEVLIIYRIPKYFTLFFTHSTNNHLVGFLLLLMVTANCVACTVLLLTHEGLCRRCIMKNTYYDWRLYVLHRFTELQSPFTPYMFAVTIAMAYLLNRLLYEMKPSTYSEIIYSSFLMIFSYVIRVFVLVPKLFAEAILRMRRITKFHSRVTRIIEETKRRNPSRHAHVSVKNFYHLMWKNRTGITTLPHVISDLPRYLRLDIRQDLVWSVFRHSPTLRFTSIAYQRWLCEYIKLEFKLPGERLYAGLHCFTNLVYLKSGVVQFISSEDNTSPFLSVTSGTLLGDISFYLPPLHRKVTVKCLTYCEIFVLTRVQILRSLHKFPKDRKAIIQSARKRIEHARSLYARKETVKGTNRKEDECVSWIKKRWWEIAEIITDFKKISIKGKCRIPPEEKLYHCPKYIGQLVLCSDVQLRTKSILAHYSFPWMILPDSYFVAAWEKFILIVVYIVLVIYPPNLVRLARPMWFECFKFGMDFIYVGDVIMSLITACEGKDRNILNDFKKVFFIRCGNWRFILDVCSTCFIEDFSAQIGMDSLHELCKFNRLLKIYKIFDHALQPHLSSSRDPMKTVCYMIFLINFVIFYVGAYFFYVLTQHVPNLTTVYFFGRTYCSEENVDCQLNKENEYTIFMGWLFEVIFPTTLPKTKSDIVFSMGLHTCIYIVSLYSKSYFIAALYLKIYAKTNYYFFVSNLKKHYVHHKIHPDLLKRLNKYLTCHWKYFHGLEVLEPNNLKEEPYDIYWKIHGEIAETIIGKSRMFKGADIGLIKELAYKAKFLILPKTATLYLFGVQCKVVTWLVHGEIKGEFHDAKGNLIKTYSGPGEMLSLSSVFLSKTALVSYIAETECEVLFIPRSEFESIIKRYPDEWAFIKNTIRDVAAPYEKIYHDYITTHYDYQRKLQENIFHAKHSESSHPSGLLHVFTHALEHPETLFIQSWLLFRAIVAALSIIVASLNAGGGVLIRGYLNWVALGCDFVGLCDIILKCFFSRERENMIVKRYPKGLSATQYGGKWHLLEMPPIPSKIKKTQAQILQFPQECRNMMMPYYDDHGLVISSYNKCVSHYLVRGFLMDFIGTFPVPQIMQYLMIDTLTSSEISLFNLLCKYAHIYLITGYFNYISDVPTINIAYITIIKWQVVIGLLIFGASPVFVRKCVKFHWDSDGNLESMTRLNSCWVPYFIKLDHKMTPSQFHMVMAESINLAQCALMHVNLGLFQMKRESYLTSIVFLFLGLIFWYIVCYSQTLLVLNNRADSILHHSVNQLKEFLVEERVEKEIIDRSIAHLNYLWIRTKGLYMLNLMNERIGVVFKQDLNYYFFRSTFEALDIQLKGGESLHRLLANVVTQAYFLSGEDVVREMDLIEQIYIVHRGEVSIMRHGKKLCTLRKGGIFGQLEGEKIRPVRITAHAISKTDLLQISIKQFQEIINEEVKHNIAEHPEASFDYIPVKGEVIINAYNTIQYILRDGKRIKLPWMRNMADIKSNPWYSRWLILVWLWATTLSIGGTLTLNILPEEIRFIVLYVLIAFDLIFLAQFLAEFFKMELVVVNNQCVYKYTGLKRIYGCGFYVDIIALSGALAPFILNHWILHWLRFLWIFNFYRFYKNFCLNIQSRSLLLKVIIVFLIVHALTCGWIYVGCRRYSEDGFPVVENVIPPNIEVTIDSDEWMSPHVRKEGCARVTRSYATEKDEFRMVHFVVPKDWISDYIVAFNYIVLLHVNTNIDSVVPVSLAQVYYKSIITIILYLVEMWLTSVTISAVYTKYRELYEYDHHVADLVTYFRHNGTSSSLLAAVKKYTRLLWQRHKGNWLPEITKQAPLCLREDILSALYMHHLLTAPLFKQLPPYFLRQLVVRMKRIVIFPGKYIVQSGDIFSCMYFIHEGEVEKCTVNSKGDYKTLAVLTMNGFFGIMPGLFPNIAYQHSYYTRTVVDLIYLQLKDWQDLLDGYPEVKYNLYLSAKKFLEKLTKENIDMPK